MNAQAGAINGAKVHPPQPKLVFATENAGKLREFRALLKAQLSQPLYTAGLGDWRDAKLPPETGADYAANARAKAFHANTFTRLPALADDSGLEVEALGGKPGMYSARYGGEGLSAEQRVQKLLREMGAAENRRARFVCTAVLVWPESPEKFVDDGIHKAEDGPFLCCETVRGVCEGVLLHAPRGEGGFGYDPVFQPKGYGLSMAELPPEEKNRISHRARALAALAPAFAEAFPEFTPR